MYEGTIECMVLYQRNVRAFPDLFINLNQLGPNLASIFAILTMKNTNWREIKSLKDKRRDG